MWTMFPTMIIAPDVEIKKKSNEKFQIELAIYNMLGLLLQ